MAQVPEITLAAGYEDAGVKRSARAVLAWVIRHHFVKSDVSWMDVRKQLQLALQGWPAKDAATNALAPAALEERAREVATRFMREIQKTFVAGRVRGVVIGPEVDLIRWSGLTIDDQPPFNTRSSSPMGAFWVDITWLVRVQRAASHLGYAGAGLATFATSVARERLAVMQNWSSMSRMWWLRIPHGVEMPALVGGTRQQYEWSQKLSVLHDPHRVLPGKMEQYYLPVVDEKCTVTRAGW